MMQRSIFRTLLGASLIGVAGVSLAAGILPTIISWLFGINSFQVMLKIRAFIMPIALLWGVGGGIIGWRGGGYTGALVAGTCGLVSGLILGAFINGWNLPLISASVLSGLIYGGFGGLIIGRAFPKSVNEA